MLAGHVGVRLSLRGRIPEVAEAVDDLLGRAAADAELEAAAGDKVGRPGILGQMERVLIAHVYDSGPYLDALGTRADSSEQREWRRELLGEVVDPEIGAVAAEIFDGLRQLDRLDEGVCT